MTFQPLIPTVLTPVAVSVLTDPAAAILAVAEALQPDLGQGFQIDALRLRIEMERAFGGSDADGAWDWKLAYSASIGAAGPQVKPNRWSPPKASFSAQLLQDDPKSYICFGGF
jgi:hypothetical protein